MGNPFNDDGDSDANAADARLTDQLERSAGITSAREDGVTPAKEGYIDGDEPVTVAFKQDDIDDDGPTRQQKKTERYRDAQDAQLQAESRARILEAENQKLRQIATMPMAQQGMPAGRADPLQQAMDANYKQQNDAFDAISAKGNAVTADERKAYMEQSRQLQESGATLAFQKNMRDHTAANSTNTAQQQLRIRHADVFENPKAQANAMAAWAKWRGDHPGQKETQGDYDKFMDAGREAADLGRFSPGVASSERDRSMHTQGGGRSAGAQPGPGPSAGRKSITLTAEMKTMADALYHHIKDPKDRYQKWANGAGKRFLEAESREGR